VPDENQRIVLLNWLVNRSVTRSRTHEPPLTPMSQLLGVLGARKAKGWTIEYWGAKDSADEAERMKLGFGHDFTRLYDVSVHETKEYRYITILLKFANMAIKGRLSLS
jgi:hypothetical protein